MQHILRSLLGAARDMTAKARSEPEIIPLAALNVYACVIGTYTMVRKLGQDDIQIRPRLYRGDPRYA